MRHFPGKLRNSGSQVYKIIVMIKKGTEDIMTIFEKLNEDKVKKDEILY